MMDRDVTAGVDCGSSAVKVVVARSRAGADGEILASSVQRIRRRNVHDVARVAFDEVCASAQVDPSQLGYVASTGDADGVTFATGHFYGMTTHARGGVFLFPEARAALDMGALHARAIKMDPRGKVLDHRMTSQCASGSGQFLENIARYLGVPLEDVGPLSIQATQTEEVSSICAVLAETDVINMVSRGMSAGDILKGIHLSIAGRLVRLLRSAGAEGVVALTGGMAADEGLVVTIRELIAKEGASNKRRKVGPIEVHAHERSTLAGAIGAALLGAYRKDQLERSGRAVPRGASAAPST